MSEVTRILDAIEHGDAGAARRLLPLIYDELRKLAARRLARELPGQTLQATALVHDAFLRLVGDEPDKPWSGRGHFFAAAAEAMAPDPRRKCPAEKTRKAWRRSSEGELGAGHRDCPGTDR